MVVSPRSMPGASGPSATFTGTVLEVTSSRRMLTNAGSLPSTLMRGSTDRTVTGTLVVPAFGSTPDRSTDAMNVPVTGLISGGAK